MQIAEGCLRHRRSGALEPRRRFILSGRQAFSAPIRRGTRVALAILSVRAESFLLNLSGELPSADGRRFAVPTAVGKRVDTCGFYPLNSRFPLFLSLAQTRDRRPLRNRGTAEDFFYRRGAQCAPMPKSIRSAGYRSATHIGGSPQARHSSAARFFSTLL